MSPRRPLRFGFTIIELLISVALVAIVLTLAIPSFQDFIVVQRLKSVNQQLVTDLQFARSEAVSRNSFMALAFNSNGSVTCYTIFTTPTLAPICNCTLGAGAACSAAGSSVKEVRTVQIERGLSVQVQPAGNPPMFAFDPVTGGLFSIPSDDSAAPMPPYIIYSRADSSRWFRVTLSTTGRPTVCASASVSTFGAATC